MVVGRQGCRALWRALALALLAVLTLGAAHARADGITNSGGDLRDGWYSNQPRLAPDAVAGSNFGQLWSKQLTGQIYAQPLVNGNSVIVATEANQVAALDTETGDVQWSVNLGTPFPASLIGCADLTPTLGITSTPVIDQSTNTIYLTYKTYAPEDPNHAKAAIYMDALDASSGLPRSGFPKRLDGGAQNAPGVTFQATTELQRPGLLLLNGVVYAGFGGHCDLPPYQGWVFGVDGTTGAIKARWSTLLSGDGAGIWQSGAGLMSDGPGRLFVSTGNGGSPTAPTATPQGQFGESIVRLAVQGDGTLQAQDFFAPSDAAHLDGYDADFASGGVTALRDAQFGTSKYPHLGVAVGKAGYVYLLNRDDLGGFQQGTGHGERVVARVGPFGGVWSRPGVWPGDGGWIAIPTASPGGGENPDASGSAGFLKLYRYRVASDGTPSLDAPVQSDDPFGFGSGAPVITSDGTTSGSAVLWIVWSPDGSGANAQLRAYDAVPRNGHLNLRKSWPIGTATKFANPGVGAGRVYTGTRDGKVYAFGAPVTAEIQAPSTTFAATTIGQSRTADVQLTVSGQVRIDSVTATPSAFATRTTGLGLPKTLTDGSTLTVPVDFTPTATGSVGGELVVTSDKGTFRFTLNGVGQAQAAMLTATPPVVSFGGAIVGDDQAGTVTFTNSGGQPLSVTSVDLPPAPFSVDAPPHPGDVIAPGNALNLTVHYRPTAVGDYDEQLTLHTSAGSETVGLSGSAGIGPKAEITPSGGWSFGDVVVGQSVTRTVTVANTGDSAMTVTKSKPPLGASFGVLDALDEATVIGAGQSRALRVTFTPTSTGAVADQWTINPGDGSGVHDVALTGRGVAAAHLTAPAGASAGAVTLGTSGAATATFANDGGVPLTITGVDAPAAPWSATDAPAAGTIVAPGAELPVHVALAGVAVGPASGTLTLHSDAGDATVALSGSVVAPPAVVAPTPDPDPVAPVAPDLTTPPKAPVKAKPGLTVSRPRLSRDGRTLAVRGYLARAATGTLRVTLKAKVGRRTVTARFTAQLTGKPTYALALKLPKAALKWTRLETDVAFPGSTRVGAGSAAFVLIRASGR
jgi:iron transport multicopper oxidase